MITSEGALMLALSTIEHCMRGYTDDVPTTKAIKNQRITLTPPQRRRIAVDRLKTIQKEYDFKLRFLNEGMIFKMTCDVIDRDLPKFKALIEKELKKDYLKSKARLEFIIDNTHIDEANMGIVDDNLSS